MPVFDFRCEKCEKVEERIMTGQRDVPVFCICGNKMMKLWPDTFHFLLKYDPKKDKVSWGNEGYSTTQRFREYDKRAKGNIFSMGDKKK